MPRKKTIDTNVIKLKNVDQSIIERKDCLRVELCFTNIKVFKPKQWETMGSCFGCRAVNDNTITLATMNSWKGLVMFFLALTYMKYKEEFVNVLYDMARANKPRQILITNVSWDYWWLVENSIGKWETSSDPRIEKIPAPTDYKPCYVVGQYEPKDVKLSIDNFCILYGIDMELSKVETAFVSNTQPRYKTNPVQNPYKRQGQFRPSTFEELMEHIRDKNRDPLGTVDLTGIGKDRSGSSEENS